MRTMRINILWIIGLVRYSDDNSYKRQEVLLIV